MESEESSHKAARAELKKVIISAPTISREGHKMKDYYTLKKKIKEMIENGELECLVAEHSMHASRSRWSCSSASPKRWKKMQGDAHEPSHQSLKREKAPLGDVSTIEGGIVEGGPTSSRRKAHARKYTRRKGPQSKQSAKHQSSYLSTTKTVKGTYIPMMMC